MLRLLVLIAFALAGCTAGRVYPTADAAQCAVRPDLDAWCADAGYSAGYSCDLAPMPAHPADAGRFCK